MGRSITDDILMLLFFTLFFRYANSSSDSGCIESEREALLEFKARLVSDGASSLSSWNGRDCCSWHGITCHNLTGHVQVFKLGGSYFNSPLSPWLFNLTHLEVLKIPSTGLIGPIPNMFDKLTSLTHLDLSQIYVDSAIFPDSLCSLTNLTYMRLFGCGFQGSLPLCLGNLTSLAFIDLSDNRLSSSIPSTFGNLRDLEYLILTNNQLSGTIPSTLGNLTRLKFLDFSRNFLTGDLIEYVLEGLKSSETLIFSLKLDEDLDLSKNQHLIFNVSTKWILPFQLSFIAMDDVFLGTQFPHWLQTQRHLSYLSLSNASISGAISLISFPNLGSIDLSNNFLTGSIPTFDNAFVYNTQLSSNQFSGNIPKNICNLKFLQDMNLGNNQLVGSIPSCLGSLRELHTLDLSNNSLFSHIPNELASLSDLYVLHLNGNKLSGKLPAWLLYSKSLVTLDLGGNKLQGIIPRWTKKVSSVLAYLRLESNNFSGEIPKHLCQYLPLLQILNLATNNLVGTIPPCLGNLRYMVSDDLSIRNHNITSLSNIFKGKEMKFIWTLDYARLISLSGNQLHGEIPVELMNLKGLQSLNLSNNELSGIIPERINNMKHLELLDLSMNRLSGMILQSLADIDDLNYLNLSFNNLAGRIPSGNHFDTLTSDQSIFKGNMNLCGKMLMKSCPGDDSATFNQLDEPEFVAAANKFEILWLYAGIGPGFAVGFATVIFIFKIHAELLSLPLWIG